MNLPEDTHLAYIVSHEAWYASAARLPGDKPHLNVSASAKGTGGGVAWEFEVSEHELGGKMCTQVRMFDDAYAAFADIPEFFILLREHQPGTLREVRGILDGLGAVDETRRTRDGSGGPKVVKGQVVTEKALGMAGPARG